MRFTKMHGAGNDFVIINNIEQKLTREELSALAARVCRRRESVGADGLMAVVEPAGDADYGMLFFNADGSEGEMCGNGARCIARYGHDHALAGNVQRIETVSGTVRGERISDTYYRVRLNDPSLIDLHRPVMVDGTVYDCAYVELGRPGLPHAVCVVENEPERETLYSVGKALRWAPEFSRGANVTFACVRSANELCAITFERGVEDFTLACGTGCGAAVAALTLRAVLDAGKEVKITMPGGTLYVTLDVCGDTAQNILLTGPTATVYEGELIEP